MESFDPAEKLGTPSSYKCYKELSGREFNVGYFQKEGFIYPILIKDSDALGIRIPNSLSISDIRSSVGSRRNIQIYSKNKSVSSMTMKDWQKYYESEDRISIYRIKPFEFTNTKLDPQIVSPKVVRQIDWIDKVWPRHLKEIQLDSSNALEDMMYPKVQKYLHMAVKGSYEDFRIDPGGSSSWIYVFKGTLTLWIIPPSDDNLKIFENWLKSETKNETFLADISKSPGTMEITAGNTLFIPGGWIHARYFTSDTVLFSGNFLHSFNVEKQLQTAFIEETTKTPICERYPFFTEMLWYVLDRYINRLLGRTHLDLPDDEKRRMKLERGENVDPNREFLFKNGSDLPPEEHTHLTQMELQGIKFIVMYLHHLAPNKKNVPVMLPDPIAVIKDVRTLVLEHKDDCPEKSITYKCILRWNETDDVDSNLKKYHKKNDHSKVERKKPGPKAKDGSKPSIKKTASGNRRRRVRCKVCTACLGGDCRICVYCKDMTKYGGPGKMKQTCEKRRCLQPQLPVCAFCSHCKLDGWFNEPKVQQNKESERPEEPPQLFECAVCLDILHPNCADKTIGPGKINSDLSNSWECAKCVNSGYSTVPCRLKKRKMSSDDSRSNTPTGITTTVS